MRFARLIAAVLAAAAPAQAAVDPAIWAPDARILAIGYRLASASADLCPQDPGQLGLALQDLTQYEKGAQAAARTELGLGEWPQVLAVAPGSPAATAGLRLGDDVTAINGAPVPAGNGAGSFVRMQSVQDALDQATAAGPVRLSIRREGRAQEVTVNPTPGCRGWFQLMRSSSFDARADGSNIQIDQKLASYAETDAAIAGLLAHELSHNILRHRVRLDKAGISRGLFQGFGRNGRLTRETEMEADRLAPYVMERAGYPTAELIAFWTRFRREKGLGVFRMPTHAGEKERIAAMQAEIDRIAQFKQSGQRAIPDFLERGTLRPLQ